MTTAHLSTLKPAAGSRKNRKRIGRGQGSGHGGTATRGHKGAKSRSGHKFRLWFEGGQMPLIRRVPKYGFTPRNRVTAQVVNLARLEDLLTKKKIKAPAVTPEILYDAGAISRKGDPVKILGTGEIKTSLEVSAHAFSKSAREKIEAAGGKAIILSTTPTKK